MSCAVITSLYMGQGNCSSGPHVFVMLMVHTMPTYSYYRIQPCGRGKGRPVAFVFVSIFSTGEFMLFKSSTSQCSHC